MRLLLLLSLLASPAIADQSRPFASFDIASDTVLNDPHDLAIGPEGNLYVADKFGSSLVAMDPETLAVLWRSEPNMPGIHDVSFDKVGRAVVAVTSASRVDILAIKDQAAEHIASLHGLPRTEGALAHSSGDIYAMASGTGMLVRFSDNQPIGQIRINGGAHDVAEAPDGTIWVADTVGRRLIRVSPDLEILSVLNDEKFGFVGPRYLDIDDWGRVIVADQDAHRVLMIDPESEEILGVIGDGKPGIGPGKFDDPEGVAVDGNRFYFADSDNNRIVRYSVVMN